RPEPHTLAGPYALDALTGADRARFERHLGRCEQCAREISGLREATARLAAAAAAEPPAGLTERALAAAARTRQLPPLTREPAARWLARHAGAARSAGEAGGSLLRRAWLPRIALGLAGAVMILTVIAGLAARTAQHQLAAGQLHSHAITAILTAPDATMISVPVTTGGTATIVMSRRERELVFTAARLRVLPASRCYQLWLIGPGGNQPAGMLPDPSQGMTGPVLASGLGSGERLGLTVEPAGGSPHPTSAMILVLAL
ncbi:MAG: anti-sigma factor domain-containing protein, partial [Streptosporangiaceae bacterium]